VRTGVRLAVDVGTSRIGLARSDATGTLAVPLEAIRAGEQSVATVAALAAEWEAIEVIVGLPLHLDGRPGASAHLAREWATALHSLSGLPVLMVDERLSTAQAQRALREAGLSTRQSRSLIDSASAVMVLQGALDQEARTGQAGGESVRTAETRGGPNDEPARADDD